jgi:hypothetical protein
MFQFSRSIYRELAPMLKGDDVEQAKGRRHLLEATEATLTRMGTDRQYFARPERSLFGEVRNRFHLSDQVRVHMVIERYLSVAGSFIDALPVHLTYDGQTRECAATTRRGTQCAREPRPNSEYCPSHRHLDLEFEAA